MGILNRLYNYFTGSSSSSGGSAAAGATKTGDSITATASTQTGNTKEELITVRSPRLKSVTWGLPIRERKKVGNKNVLEIVDAKAITRIANGVKSYMYIETQNASGGLTPCYALVVLTSDAWGDDFDVQMFDIKNSDKTEVIEQDFQSIIPKESLWKDKDKKTAKISATVYLFTYTTLLDNTWLIEDSPHGLAKKFDSSLKSDIPTSFVMSRAILHGSVKTEIDFDYCGHGMEYREEIYTTSNRAKTSYGPIFEGKTPIKNYPEWDNLINNGEVTAAEKKVICVMANNEGTLQSVQSYDSEVVSVGAMQKTVNKEGSGELPTQIYEFHNNNSSAWEKYKCCFEHHEWTFTKESGNHYAKYKGENASEATKTTIRTEYGSANVNKTSEKPCALEPFVKLAHDEEFHKKQVMDFIGRIRTNLAKTLSAYDGRAISAYVKSPLGMGTVLDHSVNRPAHVAGAFSDSLDDFFAKEENKEVSKDPSTWGTKHADYEKEILDIYGPKRSSGKYDMTHGSARYEKLKKQL